MPHLIKTLSHEKFHNYILNLSNITVPNIFAEYKKHVDNTKNTTRCYLWTNRFLLLYLIWIKRSIKNGFITIRNPFSNKLISSNTYFIIVINENNSQNNTTRPIYSLINYFFNDSKIIVGLGLGSDLGALETRILYIICLTTNNIIYNWEELDSNIFLNTYYKLIINKKNIIKKKLLDNTPNEIVSLYGFCNNIGHSLFNDISGLFILHNENIIQTINKIILGPYDFFVLDKYFKKFKNINIETFNNINCLDNYVGKGVMFKYNHTFLSNKCKNFLKMHLELHINDNSIKEDIIKIKKYYPIFNIYLRIGYNEMNDQSNVIINLINDLNKKYTNSFFILNGFCSNPNLSDNSIIGNHVLNSTKDIKEKYNSLYKLISSKINTQNCKSLINYNLPEISEYIKITTYNIYQFNSLGTISSWLFSKPGILIGLTNKTKTLYKNQDIVINEDKLNIMYLCDNTVFNGIKYSISSNTIINNMPNF